MPKPLGTRSVNYVVFHTVCVIHSDAVCFFCCVFRGFHFAFLGEWQAASQLRHLSAPQAGLVQRGQASSNISGLLKAPSVLTELIKAPKTTHTKNAPKNNSQQKEEPLGKVPSKKTQKVQQSLVKYHLLFFLCWPILLIN